MPAAVADALAASALPPVTVNILTGFLGSGKTSLLKRLLARPELRDSAVLINEFGEVGIDHFLVEEIDDDVVLLKSGCICCTIRGDLKEALLDLDRRRAAGRVPAFGRLILETTGLADPAPIVATLVADPALRHHFRIGNIVTVVDAVNGERNLDAHPESVRQAAAADRLILSKIDLADAWTVDLVERRLAALNPTADRVRLDESRTPDVSLILDDIHDAEARRGEVARWLASEPGEDHHRHGHPDVNRHGGVRAFLLTAEKPLDWARFGLWLSMLLNRHGTEVLRLKGLLWIRGVDTPVVVQGVQHLIHKPVHLDAWPDGIPATRIVVIAQGLDPATVQRSFTAFTDPQARAGRPGETLERHVGG
ncbi:GTP-binding protein (plasmid) [Skermanella rosea]|uniref:CobW family GTP-binding protein n=1 Tax=Skermanella rosea TaxID=1817965 RepID=UPI001E4F955A|nr:GTP-binding protein [Skermanella rosea]UEM07659.1 GTP-binding protein [Skermanella rosea]